MPDTLARIASLLLALALGWAAVAKLLDLAQWKTALASYALPEVVERPARVAVPVAEIAIAVTLLALSPRAGAAASLAVLALFSLAIVRARSEQGDRLPCGCFGGTRERHYKTMMARNAGLGILAAIVLGGPRDAGLPAAPSSAELLPALLVVMGAALIVLVAWQTVSMRRKSHR